MTQRVTGLGGWMESGPLLWLYLIFGGKKKTIFLSCSILYWWTKRFPLPALYCHSLLPWASSYWKMLPMGSSPSPESIKTGNSPLLIFLNKISLMESFSHHSLVLSVDCYWVQPWWSQKPTNQTNKQINKQKNPIIPWFIWKVPSALATRRLE